MKKYVKDGKVAVLISPGYGAGWSSWNIHAGEEFIFHYGLAKYLDEKGSISRDEAREIVEGEDSENPRGYFGGADDLEIRWVPVGTKFRVHEYDGSEELVYFREENYFEA